MAIRVAYQGISGAYSEGAVFELAQTVAGRGRDTPSLIPVPLASFADCFEAIRTQDVDAALLPIENNLGGSIHSNYDLLVRYDDVEVVAEHRFAVNHCIMARPGVRLEDIKEARSHPQALAQCQNWLLSRKIAPRDFYDTAGAAASLVERAEDLSLDATAAVASAGAAARYGLEILASGIEDAKGNTTRFLLVARRQSAAPGAASLALVPPSPPAVPAGVRWRTSMVFAPRSNVPGALFKALSVFALRDIDLTKLESRPATPGVHYEPTSLRRFAQPSAKSSPPGSPPIRGGSGSPGVPSAIDEGSLIEYVFFLDVAAHRDDPRMLKAADHLGEIASFVRVLGSYAASESKGAALVARAAVDQLVESRAASGGSEAGTAPKTADEQSASSQAGGGEAGGGGGTGALSPAGLKSDGGSAASTTAAVDGSSGKSSESYTVGIIGFGVFGQFLAKGFLSHAAETAKKIKVVATSRGDYTEQAQAMGAEFALGLGEFFSHSPDIIVLSTSILSFASVLRRIPREQLENKLVVDVLSVKQHPKDLLLDTWHVPATADVLLTHPMFGPESGKHGWAGLPMVFEVARASASPAAQARLEFALGLFRDQGCSMVPMQAEKHDELAAGTQFVTHLTGRVLHRLRLAPCQIATKGFEALLQLVDNTCKDSFDLFLALYRHNKSSRRQLDALAAALDEIRTELTADDEEEGAEAPRQPVPPDNGTGSGAVSLVPASGAGTGGEAGARPPSSRSDALPCAPELRYEALNPIVGAVEAPVTTVLHAQTVEMIEAGKDVISLAVGAPDWAPPESVMAAAHQALDDGKTGYTSSQGAIALRQAIATYVGRRHGVAVSAKSNVLVSNGSKQCLYQLCCALSPGIGSSSSEDTANEILVPTPAWPSFLTMPRLTGLRVAKVETSASDSFHVTPELLRGAVSKRTRAIILCNPGNPTGTTYSSKELKQLAACLQEPALRHVVVIADEIYDRLVAPDAEPCMSLFSLPELQGRVVLLNGVSKAWAMCGFRVGFMVAPSDVIRMCSKIQTDVTSCASSIGQAAAIAALQPGTDAYLREVNAELDKKRRLVIEVIRSIGGGVKLEDAAAPTAAIYVMPSVAGCLGAGKTSPAGATLSDDVEFCRALLDEKGLAVVPGSGFGCPGRVRIVLSQNSAVIADALERLRTFVAGIRPSSK